MEQKIVLKVYMIMKCEKCRVKAMQIAAVVDGVTSVKVEGEEKEMLVVTGERVDSVNLVRSLRKKVGSTSLVSVEDVLN